MFQNASNKKKSYNFKQLLPRINFQYSKIMISKKYIFLTKYIEKYNMKI